MKTSNLPIICFSNSTFLTEASRRPSNFSDIHIISDMLHNSVAVSTPSGTCKTKIYAMFVFFTHHKLDFIYITYILPSHCPSCRWKLSTQTSPSSWTLLNPPRTLSSENHSKFGARSISFLFQAGVLSKSVSEIYNGIYCNLLSKRPCKCYYISSKANGRFVYM